MKIQNPELLKTWLIGKLEKMYDKLLVSLGSTRLVLYNGHRDDFCIFVIDVKLIP